MTFPGMVAFPGGIVRSAVPTLTDFAAPSASSAIVVTLTTPPAGTNATGYAVTVDTVVVPDLVDFVVGPITTVDTLVNGMHTLRAYACSSTGQISAPLVSICLVYASNASSFELLDATPTDYLCRWTYGFTTAAQANDWSGIGAASVVYNAAGDGGNGAIETSGGEAQQSCGVRWNLPVAVSSVSARGMAASTTGVEIYSNIVRTSDGSNWQPNPSLGGVDYAGAFYSVINGVSASGGVHATANGGSWYTWNVIAGVDTVSMDRLDVGAPFSTTGYYVRSPACSVTLSAYNSACSWSHVVIEGRVTISTNEVTGIAFIGTSIIDSGNYYPMLSPVVGVPTTDLSHGSAVINAPGDPECMREQVTEAIALMGSGYNCVILDGDNAAASYLFQGLSADECATQYGAQLDRLLAAGFRVISQYRGVGNSGGNNFGAALRGPMAAMFAARPAVQIVDTWALWDRSDDPNHPILGTPYIVGDMFSDPLPTMDHYTYLGATQVANVTMRILSRYL